MRVDSLTLKVVLDDNGPENVVEANDGDYFYREGMFFWIIQKNGSWKRSNIPVKSFTATKYTNNTWYKSNIENWKYSFVNECELWYKGSGKSKKTGWQFISNRRLNNSTTIVPSDRLEFSISFNAPVYTNPYDPEGANTVYIGKMQWFQLPLFDISANEIVTNIKQENLEKIEVSSSLYFIEGYGDALTASIVDFSPQFDIAELTVLPEPTVYQIEIQTSSFQMHVPPPDGDIQDFYVDGRWFGLELYYRVVLKNGDVPFTERVHCADQFLTYNPLPVFEIGLTSSVDFAVTHSIGEHFDFTASFSASAFQGTAEISSVWLEEMQGASEETVANWQGSSTKSDPVLFATGSHSGSCALYAYTTGTSLGGSYYAVRSFARIRRLSTSQHEYDYNYIISSSVSPVIRLDDGYVFGVDSVDYYSIGVV